MSAFVTRLHWLTSLALLSVKDANGCLDGCECEFDRISKCPGVFANYTEGSPLWDCLAYNYDVLEEECVAYLNSSSSSSCCCGSNLNGNCASGIQTYCVDYWGSGNETSLNNCLFDLNISQAGECCYNYLRNINTTFWDEECPIDEPYYWDAWSRKWNYSECDDSNVLINQTLGVCGTTFENTNSQMFCLINNTQLLKNNTCCHKVVSLSGPNYFYTHDCQGDTLLTFLWYDNSWELTYDRLTTLVGFASQADLPDDPSNTSPACTKTVLYCASYSSSNQLIWNKNNTKPGCSSRTTSSPTTTITTITTTTTDITSTVKTSMIDGSNSDSDKAPCIVHVSLADRLLIVVAILLSFIH